MTIKNTPHTGLADRTSNLRILFMNRPDWETAPGGDTVVIREYTSALRSRGHTVDFSCDPQMQMDSYDIIHLVNLTMNGITEKFARSAVNQLRPFVITTLQEDFPQFISKVDFTARSLISYVESGQNPSVLDGFSDAISKLAPSLPMTSPFAAITANRLLACGENEAKTIRSMFKNDNISIVRFGGSRKSDKPLNPGLFTDTYGVSDFVLCTGRAEPRKNQLMLLAALEHENIPVVFVDGTTAYSKLYKDTCIRFKRKGQVIFTGRISEEMLQSAYLSARVHCLPSFYELPGLVSLEAAQLGCRVVGTRWGTLPDYLSDKCSYCEPDSMESIRKAVLDEFESQSDNALSEIASQYTWERSCDELISIYNSVLSNWPSVVPPVSDYDLVFDPLSLVEVIVTNIEKGNFLNAVAVYKTFRSGFPTDNQLAQVDSIISQIESKLHL